MTQKITDNVRRKLADSRLTTNMYAADPSANVFDGKIYIYPSHDVDEDHVDDDSGDQYAMVDYHVFSVPDEEAEPVSDTHLALVDHGTMFTVDDVKWAEKQMWAPDAAELDGEYYLCFPAKDYDGIFRIGMASGPTPAGPFTPYDAPIKGSYSIDPAVFVEDGEAYLFAGGLWGGQLERWQTGTYDVNGKEPEGNTPALTPLFGRLKNKMSEIDGGFKALEILDENGQPLAADDIDRRYFEGPWVHKFQDTYYLSYSTGSSHYLVYATSKDIEGPYTYGGRILEPVVGWTTHHSIVEFENEWYLFFHDSEESGGVSHKRNLRVKKLTHNPDGSIQTLMP